MVELNDIAYAVKLAINAKEFRELPRPYLGMSQLGHKCARNLWMYFRWAAMTTHNAKSERIFQRGHLEENRIINGWEGIGIKILDRQRTLKGCGGHLKGHTDGRLTNVPGLEEEVMVGEIKTMQQKYFVPLTKKGVEKAKPEYYAQANVYMHYEDANYCLHSTTNKNDEDLHIEILKYDPAIAEPLITKANDVIYSSVPPKKVSNDPTYFMCQWCDFYGPCQLNDPFYKTCRTCTHASPAPNGEWECYKFDQTLTLDEQKAACPKYDVLKV